MTFPVQTPKSKTALVAVRQVGALFEVFDAEGTALGVAKTEGELWALMSKAVATMGDVELPTPEQVLMENVVREAGASLGTFLEGRHPGVTGLAKTLLRGAAIAQRRGSF